MIEELVNNIHSVFPDRLGLILSLKDSFGDDLGIIASCLLEYRKLSKGKCFGIPAGVPHAYIHGECLEIMKSSDNVVRMGLTNKFKDFSTLINIIKNNPQI
eukprot:GHVR01129057.1.p1 GENE.GHVR01129057.1~~GHVR01129057.1.p1  ORF type:complete len:101 (+),score=3.01 GHVR01129057.1:2543-2845(+)